MLAIGIFVLTSLVSTATYAQDLLADAGSVTRSYNYVEGFYLLNLEDAFEDTDERLTGIEVDLPLLVRISVDLNEHYSIRGEFLNQIVTVPFGNTTSTIEAKSRFYELNLRYRDTLHVLANTDWVAGVGYSIAERDISFNTERVSESNDAYTAYLGLRRTISARAELELGVSFIRSTEGGSFAGSGTGDAALVYRIAPTLDVALGGIFLTDENVYGIGLRYTWN